MREKNLETCLVISMGLLLLGITYEMDALLIVAFAVGLIGLFFNRLASWITWGWYKIAGVLGMFVPKILLSLTFFLLLWPLALISRIFRKDPLQLRKKDASYWIARHHEYVGEDLENTW